jgi:hypothetical protein
MKQKKENTFVTFFAVIENDTKDRKDFCHFFAVIADEKKKPNKEKTFVTFGLS